MFRNVSLHNPTWRKLQIWFLKHFCFSLKKTPKAVPNYPINDKSALVQIVCWRRTVFHLIKNISFNCKGFIPIPHFDFALIFFRRKSIGISGICTISPYWKQIWQCLAVFILKQEMIYTKYTNSSLMVVSMSNWRRSDGLFISDQYTSWRWHSGTLSQDFNQLSSQANTCHFSPVNNKPLRHCSSTTVILLQCRFGNGLLLRGEKQSTVSSRTLIKHCGSKPLSESYLNVHETISLREIVSCTCKYDYDMLVHKPVFLAINRIAHPRAGRISNEPD